MIAEALLAPYVEGKPIPKELEAMVLARTRQLAAHEVGHTLGLQHNFAASSLGQGISVMDYPHPWITLDASGNVDLSHAYATGIGAWDKAAIRYGYSQLPPGADESAALDKLLRQEEADGLRYITDADARPFGGAHPYAHLWDNGASAPDELTRILAVRKAGLARFGQEAIRPGEPMARLEDTLVPLYLLHRYQTEAAAKWIGGLNYAYSVRGTANAATEPVSPDDQRKALRAVLQTLSPQVLTLPESLLRLLPPRPPDYPRTRESFGAHTGLTFDSQGPVEASAELSCALLFDPSRASRLVEYHARDSKQLGLDEMVDSVLAATWRSPRLQGLEQETQFTVEDVVLNHLLRLAAFGTGAGASGAAFPAGTSIDEGRRGSPSPEARARALAELEKLDGWLKNNVFSTDTREYAAHRAAAIAAIDRFRSDPAKFAPPPELPTPPGQPIGDDEF
jgi:hypothetical protein